MTDQSILADSPILELDVWNTSRNLDRFKLNHILAQLRLAGELETVTSITDGLLKHKDELSIDPTNTVRVSQSKVHGIRGFEDRVAKSDGYELLPLEVVESTPAGMLPDEFTLRDLGVGRWVRNKGVAESYSSFASDFSGLDADTISMMESSGFGRKVQSVASDSVRIVSRARIHEFDSNFYTVSFENDGRRVFDTNFAARIASESIRNAISVQGELVHVDEAIILPIEVSTTNYYHVLSEKVFGMRLLELFDSKIPIIYTGDQFRLVEQFAAKMGVDPSRLVKFEDARNWLIEKAALIYPGPYSWSQSTFEFFGKFASRDRKPFRKIYITRMGTSREFTNGHELRLVAEKYGYEVIYPEQLSIDEQIRVFSEAKAVIAGHGAGLANVAFMPPGSRVIELFPRDLFKPDYYLRTRGNAMKYSFLIADSSGCVDSSALESLLRMNKIFVIEQNGTEREVQDYPGVKASFSGVGSVVRIESGSVFTNSSISISNDSSVYVEKTSKRGIRNTRISIDGSMSNKDLYIGRNIQIEGSYIGMAGEDDLSVTIGRDNLWSSNVVLRATDGHPIFSNSDPAQIINRATPVRIGDDVWVGSSVVFMKGSVILSDSVVGQGALVTQKFDRGNVVIAGSPARIVKSDIFWRHEYISRK